MDGKKIISLGLAGVMFLGSTAFAAPLADKNTKKNQDVKVKISDVKKEQVIITTKTINHKNEFVEAEIKIPVITGLKEKMLEMRLNKEIEKKALKQLDEIEKEAKKLAKKAKGNNYSAKPFILNIDYDVKCNDDDILSVSVNNFSLTGASGFSEVDYYNIDKKTNKAIDLKDLFIEGTDFKTLINKEIKKQIQERLKTAPASYFDFEDEFGFKSIKNNQKFYLKGAYLVVVFNKYEIAPGCTGTPEFRINLNTFDDVLKKPELAKKQDVIISTKNIKEKNELIEADIKYPQVFGLKDVYYEEQLNYLIEAEVSKELQSIKKEAEDLKQKGGKDFKMNPFVLNIGYSVKCNNDDILSMVFDVYSLTGASGQTRISDYNIDKKANRTLELKDLFKDGTDFKSIINKEIRMQIAESLKKNQASFFKGEDGFKTIHDTQHFYIEEDNLVVVFPKYEIAPGYMGTPEFRIPLNKLGL